MPLTNDATLTDFIRAYIRTAWSLELLLLLHSEPERRWSPQELIKRLHGSTSLVHGCLSHFAKAGLVAEDAGTWAFASGNPELDNVVQALARTYRERPMTTLALIREADPVQGLANAFKITGDKDE